MKPGNRIGMTDRVEQMRSGAGFIAALDQSGGSTPKALKNYGVDEDQYDNDDQMFDLVHAMRSRIMTNRSFSRPAILGAILFENTMRRNVAGVTAPRYLWDEKKVLPFLKIDVGLADEADAVQLMKPIANIDSRLAEAGDLGVFGTKMRSVIKDYNESGIRAIVTQQFELAEQIAGCSMVPIVEPEIDIQASQKAKCEGLLRDLLAEGLDGLSASADVVFKLTLPEEAGFYRGLADHPRLLRIAALSGGYSQEESIRRLSANDRMIASFSRALTESLRVNQSNDEFDKALSDAIEGIAAASSN